jgi:hypothetical protein
MTLKDCVPGPEILDSQVYRAAASRGPSGTLSMRLWGLDWSKVLPWSFDGATLESGTFDDAFPFMEEHYARIFGVEPERFFVEGMTDAKRRFGDEQDVFVFRKEGKTIGVATGHPTDWSTYYIRTFALLPEYRELGWCHDWIRAIAEPLRKAGCDRWEADCSPANAAVMGLLTRNGHLITGHLTSERWGQMVRFTKFLRPDVEKAFRRQFIYVPAYGRNAQPK